MSKCLLSSWASRRNKTSDRGQPLAWQQKLKAVLQATEALHYLHSHPQGCTWHRDFKPAKQRVSKEATFRDHQIVPYVNVVPPCMSHPSIHTSPSDAVRSLYTALNVQAALHCDNNNAGYSYILLCGPYTGGGLWIRDGDLGAVIPQGVWTRFDGRQPHCTFPFLGDRVVIIAYPHASLLVAETKQLEELEGMGVPLPPPAQAESMRHYLREACNSNNKVNRGRKSFARMAEIGIDIATRYSIADFESLKYSAESKKNKHPQTVPIRLASLLFMA